MLRKINVASSTIVTNGKGRNTPMMKAYTCGWYKYHAKLTTLTNQTPAVPTHLISNDTKKHLGYVPNDRSSSPHFVMWTSQESRLCRWAYILNIDKYPSFHSYLDKGHKKCCYQLCYQEPVSCNALNLEVPTHPKILHEVELWYSAPTWDPA